MLSLLNRYILKGRNFCESIVLHSNETTEMWVLKVFGTKEPPVPVFENLKRTAGFYGRSHKELAVQGRFLDGQSRFHLLDIYSLKKIEPPNIGMHYAPPVFLTLANLVSSQE
jgi:hypothetical protein